MKTIKTTYSQVTPESADRGVFSDTGWVDEDGETFETVQDAIQWLKSNGVTEASSSSFHQGIWYSTDMNIIDYSDHTEEEQSFHLYGFSKDEELSIYNALFNNKNS